MSCVTRTAPFPLSPLQRSRAIPFRRIESNRIESSQIESYRIEVAGNNGVFVDDGEETVTERKRIIWREARLTWQNVENPVRYPVEL